MSVVPEKPNKSKAKSDRYTEEELMVRLKVFIGICLAFTLTGIVFVVLYSLIFVTQPLNAMSPIDQKFFELIIPIATFLTGTLSGIMLAGTGKDAAMSGVASGANRVSNTPTPSGFSASANIGGSSFSFNKPVSTPVEPTLNRPLVSRPTDVRPIDDDDMPVKD